MKIKYGHTNLVAANWKLLSDFYCEVFGCIALIPERNIAADWLAKASGVKNARLKGIHLQLPGYDRRGPTLEIFQYENNMSAVTKVANREGYGHIAFQCDDVARLVQKVLDHGGKRLGKIIDASIPGAGKVEWVYVSDPEGNVIEIQRWH